MQLIFINKSGVSNYNIFQSDMELREFLDLKYRQYNQVSFIASDPISIPRLFTRKEDIEIAGFLAATISWGRRASIIKNSQRLLELMDNSPYDFIIGFTETDLDRCKDFVHRTFNFDDLMFFFFSLRNIYKHHNGLESVFAQGLKGGDMAKAIYHFREVFFSLPHQVRTRKHVSNPLAGSSAKRINMFLRWMVRKDDMGVDFGLWKNIAPHKLICPLDVHSGRVARKLGLLQRKQDDWRAATELTQNLIMLDPDDPVKYDFALFGLGVFEKWI